MPLLRFELRLKPPEGSVLSKLYDKGDDKKVFLENKKVSEMPPLGFEPRLKPSRGSVLSKLYDRGVH